LKKFNGVLTHLPELTVNFTCCETKLHQRFLILSVSKTRTNKLHFFRQYV